MVAQRLWGVVAGLAGLASLLAACGSSNDLAPPLPPCTSGTPLALAVGVYQAIDPGPVSGCIVFPASASATEYLLVPQAASGTPNDTQSFKLQGGALGPSAIATLVPAPEAPAAALGPPEQFHLFLRQAERSRTYPLPQLPQRAPDTRPAPPAAAQAPPPPSRPFAAAA